MLSCDLCIVIATFRGGCETDRSEPSLGVQPAQDAPAASQRRTKHQRRQVPGLARIPLHPRQSLAQIMRIFRERKCRARREF
jgi:hypothetical protein